MAGVNGTRLNDAKIKQSNEIMATATEEVEILLELRRGGYLVAVPPGDGDDAYAIALARGEDDRSRSSYSRDRDNPSTRDDDDDDDVDARAMSDGVAIEENGMTTTTLTRSRLPMGGYVVSNDMFHDAIRRDDNRHGTNDRRHAPLPLNCRSSSLMGWLSRRRISFSSSPILARRPTSTNGIDWPSCRIRGTKIRGTI